MTKAEQFRERYGELFGEVDNATGQQQDAWNATSDALKKLGTAYGVDPLLLWQRAGKRVEQTIVELDLANGEVA